MRIIRIFLGIACLGIFAPPGVSPSSLGRRPVADEPYRLFEIYKKSDSRIVVRKKLDALSGQLRAESLSEVWLLSYGEERSCPQEATKRAEAVKKYLLGKGVPDFQIRIVDAGFKEEWSVELWQVVRGKQGPTPEPSVKNAAVAIMGRRKTGPKCPNNYSVP